MGQQLHKYENLLNRQFQADEPNSKWMTDISYIHTKEGVLYLSMIRDLYDNSIIAYRTGTQQTIHLVLDTIRLAMRKEKRKVTAELQLHSDQGFQYTSREYFNLTQSYGITPSMSRRGNCYDNAMAENLFSIRKTECIYRLKPKTFSEARKAIDDYIYFYNHERIRLKTGVAPLTLRHSAENFIFLYRGSFLCCPYILGQYRSSVSFKISYRKLSPEGTSAYAQALCYGGLVVVFLLHDLRDDLTLNFIKRLGQIK